MSENNNNTDSKTKKKNAKVIAQTITYLPEREWFIKKFETEVGKKEPKMVPFEKLEKNIKSRKRFEIGRHHQYEEPPGPDDVPDIIWNGPPLATCLCVSSMDKCECKGDLVLPARPLPIGIYWKTLLWIHRVHQLKYFKNIKLEKLDKLAKLPKTPFVKRFQEHLKAETVVQTKLKEMDLERGPVFCVLRCYHYYEPQATESSEYFKKKRQLYYEYMNPAPVPVKQIKPPPPIKTSSIADITIDGLYRTVFTQETVDENCNFVMEVSHILFGNSSVYRDIEGTPYLVNAYHEDESEKPEPMVKKLENLLSISGIKKRVSQLTGNLISSIVEIEDMGIPLNSRATQDPPLDNYFESIIMPTKYKDFKVTKEELCPCCKKYKELQTVHTDQVESNVTDNYEDFESTVIDSAFNNLCKKRHLGFSDNIKQNFVGNRFFPQKTTTTKCEENKSKVRNVNDNIELLKRDLMTSKPVKKHKSVDRNKDLYAIHSESVLNKEEEETKIDQKTTKDDTEVLKGIVKKNDQLNSLEFLESIKPCCIDNLFKRLETKITNERFVTKLLELEMLRKLERCIQKIEKERLQKLQQQNSNVIESADKRLETSKMVKFLKSSINITMKKFSDFIKKQKSSLKTFTKKIKDAHLRAQRKNALSLEDFKVKMKKSFKKMNSAVSSFCKRHYKKSSTNLKQFMSSFKQKMSKNALSLEDFKVKMKKSFKKMNSAVSSFCKRHYKKSSTNLKQFMSSFKQKMSKSVKANSSEDGDSKIAEHPCKKKQCNSLKNMPDKHDSNTSEKEVFSMQYNSTFEFNS